MYTIETDATWDNLPALNAFADGIETALPLSQEQMFILRLVVEEIVTNIIKYAYPDGPGPVTLACTYTDDTMLLKIRDRGQPFDPREAALPDLTSDIDSRKEGGLGIFLVLDMVDTLDYEVGADKWNTLTITKRQTPRSLFEILRQISLFAAFTDDLLNELAARADVRRLHVGDVLFSEGDQGQDCFVLLNGRLQVLKRVGNDELVLSTEQPGSILGEMALLDRSFRSATVRAGTECRLLVLDETSFYDLMHNNPVAAMDLLRGGTARLRSSNERMVAGLLRKNAELSRAYQELQAAQASQLRLERLQQELEVARRIQEVFLPRVLPQPPGWQIAARNRGAEEVGGDFYDCMQLPSSASHKPLIGLVMADVCGKGVPAALFVALTRSLLRAASQWSPLDTPGAIVAQALQLTNAYIATEHAPSHMFITLFYAVLDPADGTLAFINAGHNPPLLVRAHSDTIESLAATNLPVGIFAESAYVVQHATLHPGDLLLAFTDGVTEALNSTLHEFGDARLHALLHTHSGMSAAATLDAVEEAVRNFAGDAPQADDITLLALRRLWKA